MPEQAGELYVSITGDISALLSALQQGEDAAKAAGEAISSSLDLGDAARPFEALGTAAQTMGAQAAAAAGDMQELSNEAQTAGQEAAGAETGWRGLYEQIEQTGSGSAAAGASVHELGQETQETGHHAEEAESGMKGLAEQIIAIGEALVITEALKEFGQEALEAADNVTRATISLTALQGSAQVAGVTIEELEKLGMQDGLAFPALLTAGQRMVNFLGEGANVPELMAKIADGAAVAQSEIGNAATAFDRLATAGTASSRTLMPLGLSLQNIADAMNKVIPGANETAASAAKAFKALDQSERVNVLSTALDRLKGIAKDTAEQTFGGQWQALANQWEAIMKDVGEALLPVIRSLTDFAKTDVLPFLKSIVEGFQSIPAPAQEVVIAIGLMATAAVPLTAGLGAIALGLSGLEGLFPAVTGMMATFGTEAAATAVEETALATATGAGGLSGALTGLLPLLTELSPLLIAVGAAFIATQANITSLKDRYHELDTEIRTHQILDAINAGKTVADLEKLGFSVDDVKNAVGGLNRNLEQSAPFLETLGLKIKILADGELDLSKNASAYVTAQTEANLKLAQAKQAVEELTAAQDGSKTMAEALTRAQIAYKTALEAATPVLKDQAETLAGLATAMGKANETLTNAIAVLNQAVTAYDAGKISLDLLEEAYSKVQAAAKAAGTTFTDVSVEATKMTDAAMAQAQALTSAVEVYDKLKDGSIPGSQYAIRDALAAVESAASKMGITVTDSGHGLQFATDAAIGAKGPLVDLAATLTALAQTQTDGVIVNGKWVEAVQASDSGVVVLKGSAEALNTSLADLNSTWVYSEGLWQRAPDLIAAVNKAWDDAAASAVNAADTMVKAGSDIGSSLDHLGGGWMNGGSGKGTGVSATAWLGLVHQSESGLSPGIGLAPAGSSDQLAAAMGLFKVSEGSYISQTIKSSTAPLHEASQSIKESGDTMASASTTQAAAADVMKNSSRNIQAAFGVAADAASTMQLSSNIYSDASVDIGAAGGVMLDAANILADVADCAKSSSGQTQPGATDTRTPPGHPSMTGPDSVKTSTPESRAAEQAARDAETAANKAKASGTEADRKAAADAKAAADIAAAKAKAQADADAAKQVADDARAAARQKLADNVAKTAADYGKNAPVPRMPTVPAAAGGSYTVPTGATTIMQQINVNITGNVISNQAAADQLAKTMIDRLRNNAQIKL